MAGVDKTVAVYGETEICDALHVVTDVCLRVVLECNPRAGMVCRNRRAVLTPYGGGVDVRRRGDAILAVAYCRQRLLCPAQIQRGSELVGHSDLYDLVFSDAVRKRAVVRHGPAPKRGG